MIFLLSALWTLHLRVSLKIQLILFMHYELMLNLPDLGLRYLVWCVSVDGWGGLTYQGLDKGHVQTATRQAHDRHMTL